MMRHRLVFIPVYIIVQRSMYINIESEDMNRFYTAFTSSVDLEDSVSIRNYLVDRNEKGYPGDDDYDEWTNG